MAKMCPKCDLRFELMAELSDHLETDHGVQMDIPAGTDLFGSSKKK